MRRWIPQDKHNYPIAYCDTPKTSFSDDSETRFVLLAASAAARVAVRHDRGRGRLRAFDARVERHQRVALRLRECRPAIAGSGADHRPIHLRHELRAGRRPNPGAAAPLRMAKNETHNRIELLRLGADDYITKPFDIDEVLLRIQAVLRRTEQQETNEIVFREFVIKTDSKRIFINDEELVCTATEYAILELLMKNPTRIFSKRTLYEIIMGEDYLQEDNTMNVHISNLRKKIAEHTDKKYIETVYGMGYRLIK